MAVLREQGASVSHVRPLSWVWRAAGVRGLYANNHGGVACGREGRRRSYEAGIGWQSRLETQMDSRVASALEL